MAVRRGVNRSVGHALPRSIGQTGNKHSPDFIRKPSDTTTVQVRAIKNMDAVVPNHREIFHVDPWTASPTKRCDSVEGARAIEHKRQIKSLNESSAETQLSFPVCNQEHFCRYTF